MSISTQDMENYEIYLWLTPSSRGFDLAGRHSAISPQGAVGGFMQCKGLLQAALAQAFVACEHDKPALTLWGVSLVGGALSCQRHQP